MEPPQPLARPAAIAKWLFVVAGLVFAMVIIGGITRLTESGLSITEWKPVSGAIPPLNAADWAQAFDLYKATPQYREVSGPAGMSLGQFQFIFFWEWVHRQLGRIIGLAFAIPLLWFAVRRFIPRGYAWRLVALLMLGGAQGALGWFMVQSGLAGRTEVSHLRLSAHLLLALFTFGALIWTALDLRALVRDPDARPARLRPFAALVLAALGLQLMLGAWVAGLRAGPIANTWPLMNDRLLPAGIDWSHGIGFAITHDPYLIHFVHRWWAWAVVILLVLFARRLKPLDRRVSIAIHSTIGLQIVLGIATVMSGVALWLAILHQAIGAILVAAAARGAHLLSRANQPPI
ncbi:COX15/CtaA family protein [Sphingomonas sp.]|uniref:COX15/CtaA family protein n=1 Tax=Sphingomonas sp. TaxID=28214 RepID=UPI00286B0CD0|nr:COX15/CtaA family protein [Sphingomonas sp.]